MFVALGAGLYLTELREKNALETWTLLGWAVLPLVAISLGSSKLIHYLYPFVPPLALFAGRAFGHAARQLGELPGRGKGVGIAMLGGLLLMQGVAWHDNWQVLHSRPREFKNLWACLETNEPTTLLDGENEEL